MCGNNASALRNIYCILVLLVIKLYPFRGISRGAVAVVALPHSSHRCASFKGLNWFGLVLLEVYRDLRDYFHLRDYFQRKRAVELVEEQGWGGGGVLFVSLQTTS